MKISMKIWNINRRKWNRKKENKYERKAKMKMKEMRALQYNNGNILKESECEMEKKDIMANENNE